MEGEMKVRTNDRAPSGFRAIDNIPQVFMSLMICYVSIGFLELFNCSGENGGDWPADVPDRFFNL